MSSEKKERSFVIDAIILCVITLVLGFILAEVYSITKQPIKEANAKTENEACEAVISALDGAEVADAGDDAAEAANEFMRTHVIHKSVSEGEVEEEASDSYSKHVVVTAMKKLQVGGSDAGYVYIASAKKGYGGSISFVLGVCDGVVTGLEITNRPATAFRCILSRELPRRMRRGRLRQCPVRRLLPVRSQTQSKGSFYTTKS